MGVDHLGFRSSVVIQGLRIGTSELLYARFLQRHLFLDRRKRERTDRVEGLCPWAEKERGKCK